jgi:hypothetical protein
MTKQPTSRNLEKVTMLAISGFFSTFLLTDSITVFAISISGYHQPLGMHHKNSFIVKSHQNAADQLC